MGVRLDEDGVRRAWVHGQLLDDPSRSGRVSDVVSVLFALQAQELHAAGFCLRARSDGLALDDLYRGFDDHSLMLTWTLRGTRHLHLTSDVPWLLSLVAPAFARPGRRAQQLGVAGEVGDRAVRVLGDALASDGPLTRRQVKHLLAPLGVDPLGQAPIHVIRRAALEGVLCVLPIPGGDERYVHCEQWLELSPSGDADQALAALARRYLRTYAPASPADFARWSGLGARVARAAWFLLSGELTEVETPLRSAWALAEGADGLRAPGDGPAPLRLLGAFDAFLLGHDDRTLIVPDEYAPKVNAGGGMIKPTVLADGKVVGTWTFNRRRQEPEVELFRSLTGHERAALEGECRDVHRFMAQ